MFPSLVSFLMATSHGILSTVQASKSGHLTHLFFQVSGFAEKSAWPNAKGVKDTLVFHDLYEQAGSDIEQSQDLHQYGTVWNLIPGVISTMYEHQREAFEFIWTI